MIPRDEYERLRAAAEDAADVAALQRVLDDPDESWAPAELVHRIAEGEHPVRVWRTHRGMTARSLAAAAGIPSSYLSTIERGVKPRLGEGAQESRHRPRRAAGRLVVTAAREPDRYADHDALRAQRLRSPASVRREVRVGHPRSVQKMVTPRRLVRRRR